MSRVRALLVRVVVIRQGSQWLAQGLEYNLATQGPSDKHAIDAFVRVLRAHLRKDASLGREPLEGVPEGPAHFHRFWDESRAEMRPLYGDHEAGVPPAYMLKSISENAKDLH
jgi:hypothetical protein